ncbi:hypothetical protein DFJ67_2582 [Asanoa ferruginea]|uniref:Uncharacterized protein n=1 Tax=Asanoa ferruginea TaxID=53367 RepID=A0A3D9ZKY5_9ACTN|nr:hypothetical protein [Asanoa ferruginea]REF96593.1 hypothetical protein DFJ67_2582 [Asanoa ferruginea]GIF49024.1 hypothetical protein Afe04nite_35630 [Asanoa ferruginea]
MTPPEQPTNGIPFIVPDQPTPVPVPVGPGPAVPHQSSYGHKRDDADAAWDAYCAAAQRLDTVRRGAATAAGEQAQVVRAARDELASVRARLVPQQARLREAGVPETELHPTPADAEAANRAVAGGPSAVLAALHHARSTADRADAALLGAPGAALTQKTPPVRTWLRNMLVYGPFSAAVLAVQIALLVTAGGTPMSIYALGCGLTLPLAALAFAWVTIGAAFPAPGGKVDRTLGIGAIVCFAPVLITLIGTAVMAVMS